MPWALLLIDIQHDFLPGGRLAVAHGDAILPRVEALVASREWAAVATTQDWHPPNHTSFLRVHGVAPYTELEFRNPQDPAQRAVHTTWPDHCVQFSPGAELHPAVAAAVARVACPTTNVTKGLLEDREYYLCFQDTWGDDHTPMAAWLHRHGITHAVVVGLAFDYCVLNSARHCAAEGIDTYVVTDCTAPVFAENNAATAAAYRAAGVTLVASRLQLPAP